MRIRAYTLDVHVGHAPCWMYDKSQNCELLTLANCKPRIRDLALEGEWVAGVTPRRMEHRLAYLMHVSEPITRTEYWKRYKDSRFDSIYKPKIDGGWVPLKNPWHWDKESFEDDSKSEWVLLSKEFYVFANSYSIRERTPKGLQLPGEYSALARGGMRSAGHFIDLSDSFLPWIRKQPRLTLPDFQVLRDFGDDGCGRRKEEEVSLMVFKPHRHAEERRRSAVTLIKFLLASKQPEVLPDHVSDLIDVLLWRITEADGKYNTRYKTSGALECADKSQLRYEHVYPRSQMIAALVKAKPEQLDGVLKDAVGCTVTREEHEHLHKFVHEHGWDRYRKAELVVIDTETGERMI